jgi:fucose permease
MEVAAPAGPPAAGPSRRGALQAGGSRKALAGFFVSGLLFSFLGAILPAWGYHLYSDYGTIGWYFLSAALGILTSSWAAGPLLGRKGIAWTLAVGCSIGASSLLYLAAVSPPAMPLWRVIGLFGVGLAAGIVHAGIFQAIAPIYRHDPAATINLSGILFGSGCLAMALFISGTFYLYTVPAIQILAAAVPGFFAIAFARTKFEAGEVLPKPYGVKQIASEFRTAGSFLLGLLVFFQFGNEWALAGWLPLYLIQRLGISPAAALLMLAFYWFALTLGRVVAQSLIAQFSHLRLLLAATVASMLGCLILFLTDNSFGAYSGIAMIGSGFALTYPLVIEKVGHRSPDYQPGFYNRSFALAFTAGLLAPSALGYLASFWGVRTVMAIPLVGTAMVFLIITLIWLEARIAQAQAASRQ